MSKSQHYPVKKKFTLGAKLFVLGALAVLGVALYFLVMTVVG